MNINEESGGSDSDEIIGTPEELKEIANSVTLDLLPEKSKNKYEHQYKLFSNWCRSKKVKKISESVLLVYISELSKVMKPPTLWGIYSMLKATIRAKDDIDLSQFKKVIAFIKKQNVGHEPKKSKTLTKFQIDEFIRSAPDEHYLMKKCVLILGIAGACRRNELTNMRIGDIEDRGSVLIVKVPDTKTYKYRSFTVTNDELDYLNILRNYLKLRPENATSDRLFLRFNKGICINQNVGVNTIAKIPSEVAVFLKLSDPHTYTGHCYRRSSATLLVEAGGDLLQLKRHGGWKSSTVAEGYVDSSLKGKVSTGHMILGQSTSSSVTTATVTTESNQFQEQNSRVSSTGSGITISNCQNCTFNININNGNK